MAESTGTTPAAIRTGLVEGIDATHVDIEDISAGCGQAFEATIVSEQFLKKTTLARHRLVNTALKEEIAKMHAWTPKCFTPDEWARKMVKEPTTLPQGV